MELLEHVHHELLGLDPESRQVKDLPYVFYVFSCGRPCLLVGHRAELMFGAAPVQPRLREAEVPADVSVSLDASLDVSKG